MNIDQAIHIQTHCGHFDAYKGQPGDPKKECSNCILNGTISTKPDFFPPGIPIPTVCNAVHSFVHFSKFLRDSLESLGGLVTFDVDKFCKDLAKMGGSDVESKKT